MSATQLWSYNQPAEEGSDGWKREGENQRGKYGAERSGEAEGVK